MNYFPANPFWKWDIAIEHCISKGYQYHYEGDQLMIEVRFTADTFCIEDGPQYDGYERNMDDWNGWRQPYFTREVAEKIVADMNDEDPDQPHLKWDGDKLLYQGWADDPEVDTIEPQEIEVDGKMITVYAMGLAWIWSLYRADEEEEDDEQPLPDTKIPIATLDLRPTWTHLLPVLLRLYAQYTNAGDTDETGFPEEEKRLAFELVEKEFRKMAEAADLWIEYTETELNLPNPEVVKQ